MNVQLELFDTRALVCEFIAEIERRIGGRKMLSVSDTAEVMNKSNNTIIELCDTGKLIAVDLSSGNQRVLDIFAPSIVALYRRQQVGNETNRTGAYNDSK